MYDAADRGVCGECPIVLSFGRPVFSLSFEAISRLNKLDHIINTETKEVSHCASKMARWEAGGRKQFLHVAREWMMSEVQIYLSGFK